MDTPEEKREAVERVDQQRKEVRLSHSKLCELAKVDRVTWWRYRQNPDLATLGTIGDLELAIAARRRELAA